MLNFTNVIIFSITYMLLASSSALYGNMDILTFYTFSEPTTVGKEINVHFNGRFSTVISFEFRHNFNINVLIKLIYNKTHSVNISKPMKPLK